MKNLSYPAAVLLSCLLLLAGCAGAPAESGDATGAAGSKGRAPDSSAAPAPPSRPAAPPASQRPPAPEPAAEGMTLYELQERLAKLGYKPGLVDGIPGPRTTDALKKYQADNNLAVTGIADADTIRKLRSTNP